MEVSFLLLEFAVVIVGVVCSELSDVVPKPMNIGVSGVISPAKVHRRCVSLDGRLFWYRVRRLLRGSSGVFYSGASALRLMSCIGLMNGTCDSHVFHRNIQ